MTQDFEYEDICLCDADVSSDGSRLIVSVSDENKEYRAFLETLDGIEFGPIIFDGNEEFGATFLNNDQNHDKIKAAGYSLMLTYPPISISTLLKMAKAEGLI
jgi:hypothetical protein